MKDCRVNGFMVPMEFKIFLFGSGIQGNEVEMYKTTHVDTYTQKQRRCDPEYKSHVLYLGGQNVNQ